MSDSESSDEDDTLHAPPASAAEQGSALAVTASLLGRAATVAQDPLAGGHHATVWDGARALLALLEASPARQDALRGRRVLEVGAGTGLLGIALALALGTSGVLTDLPVALPALRANVASNYVGARVGVEALEWGEARPEELRRLFAAGGAAEGAGEVDAGEGADNDADDDDAGAEARGEQPFDFIIGTDVVFSESLAPLLLATVAAVAARSDEIFQRRRRRRQQQHQQQEGAAGGLPPPRRCSVIFANEVRDLRAQAVFERAAAQLGFAPVRPLKRRDLPSEWRAAKGQDDVLLVFEMRLKRRGDAAPSGAEGAEGEAAGADR